jgi:hypothetical protein
VGRFSHDGSGGWPVQILGCRRPAARASVAGQEGGVLNLEYGEWEGVPGSATTVEERPSVECLKCWVWKGKPVKIEGKIFQRRDKRNGQTWIIFSAFNPNSCDPLNGFDDYFARGNNAKDLFGFDAEQLCGRVLDLLKEEVERTKEAYHWALRQQDSALRICTPFFPEEAQSG